MKTTLTALAAAVIAATAFGGVRIAIDPGAKGHDVPKTLYGIFFEDINHAADGGVYPELIENRGFDWKTKIPRRRAICALNASARAMDAA